MYINDQSAKSDSEVIDEFLYECFILYNKTNI